MTQDRIPMEDYKIEATGIVTHGPGTRVITVTVLKGNVPTDERDKVIDLDVFVAYLTDMTNQWVVESREF